MDALEIDTEHDIVWPSVLVLAKRQALKPDLSDNLYNWIKMRLRSNVPQIMMNSLSILHTITINAGNKVRRAHRLA